MNVKERMTELIQKLNAASKAYYQEDTEIMSNLEYDNLYDELVALEKESGIVLANSPTVNVGYESVDFLPKEAHESRMLSLDKTKDREQLVTWLNGKEALLSWKLDGLTIVLTYENGMLVKAVTRGNGEVGEVITNNALTFINLPHSIPYKGKLVLRGEAVISYSDFERINASLPESEAKYKNPRNLCSGSVRQLSNEITAGRFVRLYAFTLVSCDGNDFAGSRAEQMEFLRKQGFEVVEYYLVNPETILERIDYFAKAIEKNDIPSDGLVLTLEDLEYSRSLGQTAKFPRDAIAFKWADEQAETVLRNIEWSPSRTGLINPVAIFDPVELEGTTVSRASVHNISIMEELRLGIGDRISVYKANMIIPQIYENLTKSGELPIPDVCPACGGRTSVKNEMGTKTLVCTNPLCSAKKIKSFTLFVSRDALNIDGMSEATLEKLIARGCIHEYADLFMLERYSDVIVEMEGFGEKSLANMLDSAKKASKTTLSRVLYGLGIANIGVSMAKVLCRHFEDDLEAIRSAEVDELASIEGIGEVIARAVCDYFKDEENMQQLERLLKVIEVEKEERSNEDRSLAGMICVITGSLNQFESRNAMKAVIEGKGGKVTGSVTRKTTCLINNDVTSSSNKNRTAKELGVRIISEDDFVREFLSM